MAFPTVDVRDSWQETLVPVSGEWDATVPLTNPAAGQILLVVACIETGFTEQFNVTDALLIDGWRFNHFDSRFYSEQPGLGEMAGGIIAWKVLDGTEGSSVTLTLGCNVSNPQIEVSGLTWQISGASQVVSTNTGYEQSQSGWKPPALTPAWGAEDTLWIAAGVGHNGPIDTPSYPTNYSQGRYSAATSPDEAQAIAAERELNAASEDPGDAGFGRTMSQPYWMTIAVRPGTPYRHSRYPKLRGTKLYGITDYSAGRFQQPTDTQIGDFVVAAVGIGTSRNHDDISAYDGGQIIGSPYGDTLAIVWYTADEAGPVYKSMGVTNDTDSVGMCWAFEPQSIGGEPEIDGVRVYEGTGTGVQHPSSIAWTPADDTKPFMVLGFLHYTYYEPYSMRNDWANWRYLREDGSRTLSAEFWTPPGGSVPAFQCSTEDYSKYRAATIAIPGAVSIGGGFGGFG